MAKTITTTIKWRNAAEELPEKSCAVVVWTLSTGYCTTLNYSARHRLFNACDSYVKPEARRLSIRVQYWCYKEELMEALCPKKNRRKKAKMTNEEAIKELLADRALYECDIVTAGDGTPDGDLMLALDIAVAAIERQLPKKPIRGNYSVPINGIPTMLDENEFLKCPSCRHIDTILKYGQKYCHHCGQSIDWSEIK